MLFRVLQILGWVALIAIVVFVIRKDDRYASQKRIARIVLMAVFALGAVNGLLALVGWLLQSLGLWGIGHITWQIQRVLGIWGLIPALSGLLGFIPGFWGHIWDAGLWWLPPVLNIVFSGAMLAFFAVKAKQYGKEVATPPEAQNQPAVTADNLSYFDGKLIQFVGWCLLGSIVLPFSLGFAFPWWLCKIHGWKVNHTVIEGRRLKFNGTGMSLFGHYLLWSFLTIITLGIYGWWLIIFVNKWLTKNTSFAEVPSVEISSSGNAP